MAGRPTPTRIANDFIRSSGHWGKDFEVELRRALTEAFGRSFWIEAMLEPLPVETNRIELDREVKDYFGNPCPRIIYSITDYEKASIRRADHMIKNIFEALGAHTLQEAEIGFGAHQSGTCRMGHDPNTSVVDRNLCAHDVKNLYIVGSSVFYTIGALMPTLTIATVALRLGDYLLSIR
jgi:glucose dehydrogenase